MIHLNRMELYRENNRIEAKRAAGGLPHSIWETYSAFANTLGGMILLGVEEDQKGGLRASGLADPEAMVAELWRQLDEPGKVSVNLLREEDVHIETVDGKRIIVIDVPRAGPWDLPVYVNGDPMTGTYSRNGEGDYHCDRQQISDMLDARNTHDGHVLEKLPMGVIVNDSVEEYRSCLGVRTLANKSTEDLLQAVGAAGIGSDGELHPTHAGVLFFADRRSIFRIYPEYKLEYLEFKEDRSVTHYLNSTNRAWSGNIMGYYSAVCPRLQESVGADEPELADAVQEALINCLCNADYADQEGVVVARGPDVMIFSNPGFLRVQPEDAILGGFSDPLHPGMMRIFGFMNMGSMRGDGVPQIFRVWREHGWRDPFFQEDKDTPRTSLILPFGRKNSWAYPKPPMKGSPVVRRAKERWIRDSIVENLTELGSASLGTLSWRMTANSLDIRDVMRKMSNEGLLEPVTGNSHRVCLVSKPRN